MAKAAAQRARVKPCDPPVPGTWERSEPPPIKRLGRGMWTQGRCRIIVSRDPAGDEGRLLWHLSISHPSRHPTWDEIKAARYMLLPLGLTFGLLLPPPDEYVNIEAQDHVFHLWEVNDSRGRPE